MARSVSFPAIPGYQSGWEVPGMFGTLNETNCLLRAGERGKAAVVMTSVKAEALATALAILPTADIRG